MFRHIALVLLVAAAGLAAGVYMVPGPREQWTMLIRDERNAEALDLLERQYAAGERDPEAMSQLYKLLMSLADIERATTIIEEVITQRPDDSSGLAMLAQHYGETQDTDRETRTLERLFALQPSSTTAQRLLVLYRLSARLPEEKSLLTRMLPAGIITADDAERLGFMLAAENDFEGARRALQAFDLLAPPERSVGRFALYDVLLRIGDTKAAMAMMERWLMQSRDEPRAREGMGRDFPLERLVRLMAQVDPAETQRVVCVLVPKMPALDAATISALPGICTEPGTASGSVEIQPEGVDKTRVVVTTTGSESDRSTP
jgi:tetratricopeptide (TPR) repeat protein